MKLISDARNKMQCTWGRVCRHHYKIVDRLFLMALFIIGYLLAAIQLQMHVFFSKDEIS